MNTIFRNLIFFRNNDLGNISIGFFPLALTIHYPYNELQYNYGIEVSVFSLSFYIMIDENLHFVD
jgi:hypothetical protein